MLSRFTKAEEGLRNDWRQQLKFFEKFKYITMLYDDLTFEKRLFPILDVNLREGNRAVQGICAKLSAELIENFPNLAAR